MNPRLASLVWLILAMLVPGAAPASNCNGHPARHRPVTGGARLDRRASQNNQIGDLTPLQRQQCPS